MSKTVAASRRARSNIKKGKMLVRAFTLPALGAAEAREQLGAALHDLGDLAFRRLGGPHVWLCEASTCYDAIHLQARNNGTRAREGRSGGQAAVICVT